ncbi:MAG: nicotinate-nucleotide--dimethylbenzimidazole phosphoribosyltransferase [Clostridia bacterium]|nr:nicotinate-nucleotide--dimethylbenzimidazole phosphoribosyltransferase [Clostridia bacterium]
MNVQIQARKRWDNIAKPLHSLGLLEDLVVKIAAIQETADVCIERRCVLVFCGDHGVVRKGVSQTDSSVTAIVAKSIAEGTANINLMASAANADVAAVDMGMLIPVPGTVDRRIGRGTSDITESPAMSRMQAEDAIAAGIEQMKALHEEGYRIAVIGEMGIGNTTAASAITSVLLRLPPEEVTGRGAGLSDAGLQRKISAIHQAIRINKPNADDPVDVLAKLGGYELAGMAGACLGGLKYHIPVIPDGMIPMASALVAARIEPAVLNAILPGIVSKEPADRMILDSLGLNPVIHAQTALGEGTGGVLLLPLLDMALKVYYGLHTFDALKMEAYTPQEESE